MLCAGNMHAAGKYEDPLGLSLPTVAVPFCDAWKRTEELLQGLPAVPMVCLRPAAPGEMPTPGDGKKGAAEPAEQLSLALWSLSCSSTAHNFTAAVQLVRHTAHA